MHGVNFWKINGMLTMILASGQRADWALRPVVDSSSSTAVAVGQHLSSGTSSPAHQHSFAQQLSNQIQTSERSFTPRPNSSAETIRPAAREASTKERPPRHVEIVISPTIISSVLRGLPPSPTSPQHSFDGTSIAAHERSESQDAPSPQRLNRPRHIPIVIPSFAHPQGQFPPTPSTSADNTPKASPKPHSCEAFYLTMSRPTTSTSRTSTIDSNTSGPSPGQTYISRFLPSSSTYLADMNSSSESSLNQNTPEVLGPGAGHVSQAPNTAENAQISTDGSPNAAQNAQTSSAATTNLSGLVCNVHKCTGREPLARVGATTTILGDKLYVFGGRILSRKQSMKVTSDMFELDLIKRHWIKVDTTGSIPKARYFHTVCALGDSKLICYGGMSPTPPSANSQQSTSAPSGSDPMENMMVMSDIHVYDTVKRMWTYIATHDTPPGRYAHCAAVVPSSAVFTSANAPLSAILHNPPSSVPNQGTLGVALDGSGGAEMIVVGGQDSHNKYIDAISVFNLRSLKWTDTKSLERSCGAYRSVVTPLTSLPASKIGAGPDPDDAADSSLADRSDSSTSMLIYSNYNFLDVKLELQARLADGTLVEKEMCGNVSPPGLRFPSGDILDNHFIVSGTYLTSSKHEYALWALDLRTLTWSRIDAGGGIFSQGSWNRGILWSRRNTFVILGNRKRVLVEDYNRRRINFTNICMVELEAFGLYDNPRRVFPSSTYASISAPIFNPLSSSNKSLGLGGRPLPNAAVDLGLMAMGMRDLADMDLLAINGERIPVNSQLLSRRWGPYFVQLLRDSSTSSSIQNDASSSSDGGTLRPGHLNPQSIASRNSSITITPSINTINSAAPSSTTVTSSSSNTLTSFSMTESLNPHNLSPSSRPRQLYLPHTVLTIRALVHFLYSSSLPPPNHELCTPQILCSLLQLARPYRVDGLLEATVERLHQVLDGRNAAAVFNAAAMAAGGGRGTGTPFGKEGEFDLAEDLQTGLTITRLQARSATGGDASSRSHQQNANGIESGGEESESVASGSNATTSSSTSASEADTGGARRKASTVSTLDEVWAGGTSCVVGLQKRGLRGLMEGRRMRERERGRTVGGLGNGGGAGVSGGGGGGSFGSGYETGLNGTMGNHTATTSATGGLGVGLGIA